MGNFWILRIYMNILLYYNKTFENNYEVIYQSYRTFSSKSDDNSIEIVRIQTFNVNWVVEHQDFGPILILIAS